MKIAKIHITRITSKGRGRETEIQKRLGGKAGTKAAGYRDTLEEQRNIHSYVLRRHIPQGITPIYTAKEIQRYA